MKISNHNCSKLKHQLRTRADSGQKYVIWKLSPEQRDYVSTKLGYATEPFLYSVLTRKFSPHVLCSTRTPIVKKLHFAAADGKSVIFCELTKGDKKFLSETGIKFRAEKYKIFLNPRHIEAI